MINQELTQLAKQFNLIDFESENEPYILSAEEEKGIIEHEVEQQKNYMRWKMKELVFTDGAIEEKILATDWEKAIDRDKALQQANSNKHQDLWHKEQQVARKEKAKKELHELREKCSAKYMLQLMKSTSLHDFGKPLIINEYNTKLIKTICFFLSNDGRFESELGYTFKKGLLIRGVSGLGKTHLIKCVEKNELYPILVLSMVEIADQIKAEGEFYVQLGDNKITYLDDVGTEEATINHFGTKINWYKNFIETYYLRNKIYSKLIVSTNNNFAEIAEKYGFRVSSRMRDMFNVIDVSGKDMRG